MIQIAVGDVDDALDILQDSMMKFVKSYSKRSRPEWKPLFYRIVQNNIRDWYRKEKTKKLIFGLLPFSRTSTSTLEPDPMQAVEDQNTADTLSRMKQKHAVAQLENALRTLPVRQQQVFLLRAWQGLSVKDTANAMACTQGTVKTHYSRAVGKLKQALEGFWP